MNIQAGLLEEAKSTTYGTRPESLRNRYEERLDCYFSTPAYELLAKPPFANLLNLGSQSVAKQVKDSLRLAQELGHENALVIGAVPFEATEKPHLRLSTNTQFGEKIKAANLDYFGGSRALVTEAIPSPEEYKSHVEQALEKIGATPLQKVVLSRTLHLKSSEPLSIKPLIERLEGDNPLSYVFAVEIGGDDKCTDFTTFVGASPELLISVRDGKIRANPLAGSEPRSQSAEENKRRAEKLLASGKDRHEHQLVIDEVLKTLAPLCKDIYAPHSPSVISTPTMLHLSTEITGELKSSEMSSMDLALALHPTPAVCGFPRQQAKKAIDEIEVHERGAFTGIVGWCDAAGNGDWVVSIRCASIAEQSATLYAGAGIVKGSCPQKECAETQAKFQTMLNALQGERA